MAFSTAAWGAGLEPAQRRTPGVGKDRRRQRRRAVGDAPGAQGPAAGVRPPAGDTAGRTPWRETRETVARLGKALSMDTLTIGFARRFATYKRANLVFQDLEQVAALINDPQFPIQFVFAGKAHPMDGPGKSVLRQIAEFMRDPQFAWRHQTRQRVTPLILTSSAGSVGASRLMQATWLMGTFMLSRHKSCRLYLRSGHTAVRVLCCRTTGTLSCAARQWRCSASGSTPASRSLFDHFTRTSLPNTLALSDSLAFALKGCFVSGASMPRSRTRCCGVPRTTPPPSQPTRQLVRPLFCSGKPRKRTLAQRPHGWPRGVRASFLALGIWRRRLVRVLRATGSGDTDAAVAGRNDGNCSPGRSGR